MSSPFMKSSSSLSLSRHSQLQLGSSSSIDRTGSQQSLSRSSASLSKDENVLVSVRVRPLSQQELANSQQHIWDVIPGHTGKVCLNPGWKERLKKQTANTDFQYDQVFVGSDNTPIFEDSVTDLVWSAMEGLNATVFAYGQTSSGKTFTMMGTDSNPGVIPRTIDQVFSFISETSNQREFLLRVSYLEIYNEQIKDLLNAGNTDLRIVDDKHRGIHVSPLTEEIVMSPEHVLDVIERGERNRHVSSTDYNEHSSRSHTIFQLIIESKERTGSTPSLTNLSKYRAGSKNSGTPVRISCLNLIDLAGSEKASSSADRRREGAFINRSLLTLGNVISKLTEEKAGHIPFRDSKLTRILQPALQGNARVSVICTISPSVHNHEESTNTLKFAARIKKVVTNARTNEIMDDKALLQQYKNEINELKTKLTELSAKEAETSQLAAEKMRLEEELEQQEMIRSAFKERIDQLTKMILTSSSLGTKAIVNTWQTPEDSATPTSAKPQLKRITELNSPESPKLSEIQAELAEVKETLNRKEQECETLQVSVDNKERYIKQLLAEVEDLKRQKSTGTLDETESTTQVNDLRTELHRLELTNQTLEKSLKEQQTKSEHLDLELRRLKAFSPPVPGNIVDLSKPENTALTIDTDSPPLTINPELVLELQHKFDILKTEIQDLNVELAAKDRMIEQLKKDAEKDRSIYKVPDPPELPIITETSSSPNARLLSSLLRPTANSVPAVSPPSFPSFPPSPARSPQKFSTDDVSISPDTKNVLQELHKHVNMSSQVQHEQKDIIDLLETELSLTRAELGIAQLRNVLGESANSDPKLTARSSLDKQPALDQLSRKSSSASADLREYLKKIDDVLK